VCGMDLSCQAFARILQPLNYLGSMAKVRTGAPSLSIELRETCVGRCCRSLKMIMAIQEAGVSPMCDNNDEEVFQQLEHYPWHSDSEFQNGLHAILGPDPSPDQAEQLTLRARCFYFSRYASLILLDFN